jgi:hypothetical protein
MADSRMGCIVSSLVLDSVFDYCNAFTAIGRALRERERVTQIIILSVILYKYAFRKPVIFFAILCLSPHVYDNEFLFIPFQNNISV